QRMLQQQYWSDTGWQAMTADPQLEIALFPVSRKHYSLFCPQHSLRPNNLQANSEGPVNNVTLNAAREFCHWLNAVSRCQKKHLEFQLPDATHLQTIRQTVQPGQHADFAESAGGATGWTGWSVGARETRYVASSSQSFGTCTLSAVAA
ncbi:MAG: hypothetical protein ACK5YO_03550, partial [Planctomyces sp.]